ncbi:MAG: hypothetical protein ABFS56_28790 [Pseudomonadota bacterium]
MALGYTYGTLVIWKVNGTEVEPQRIYCTPKLYYPFTTSGSAAIKYKFPKHKAVRVYEKWDGSNICQYFYKDELGQYYTTYKTRLSAVLENKRRQPFVELWKEMLAKYPEIEDIPAEQNCMRNFLSLMNFMVTKIFMWLGMRLLFAINQTDASIHTPDDNWGFGKNSAPVANLGEDADIVGLYEKMRYKARAESRKEGDYIVGNEGYVFYVLTSDDKWIMYKCKSDLPENRHWVSDCIPRSIINPTVWNALETEDDLTREQIITLLLEEFDEKPVYKSVPEIDACVKYVTEKVAFREKLLKLYTENNLDVNKDKKGTMIFFSQHLCPRSHAPRQCQYDKPALYHKGFCCFGNGAD